MDEISLLRICAAAFFAVFVVLSALALLIRLIVVAFPMSDRSDDAPVVAAIGATLATMYPGARVTRIEEKT
jgi:hypothetical protein